MSAKKTGRPGVKIVKVDKQSSDGEGITDIQNYLASFNKEIEGGDGANGNVGIKFENNESSRDEAEQESESGEGGAYYVDQSTGQYYFESTNKDGQKVMTAVHNIPDNHTLDGEFVSAEDNDDNDEEEEIVPDKSGKGSGGGRSGAMVLNSGDSFQTVTIVPSENSSGEVSYVLIVQPPDRDSKEKEEDDQDLTVYDFDDHDDPNPVSGAESGDEEDNKSKIMKLVPRKSQTVTPTHMCNYCNYTTPKRYLLSRHMKSHSEERPHKCSVCERGFKTLASLQNHVNTHTGTKPHRCKYCMSSFTTSGELVRHVRYKHTHEKPHKCSICDYASVELSKMRNHMRCHTGERPYQCPHCTYASPDTFKLKRHLRIHTGEKPYECDICASRFTQSNSLKAHKLIHTAGDKPVYKCELCPATCGRKTDLRIHVQKLHTSDKPLQCKRCGKQFPDRYSYKVHSKSHEGEKCWKCDLCPYASVSQRHLESHMLIHTDEKPFQCELCDQSFRQKQLLKRHQNLYHNPSYIPPAPKEKTHECPECQRAFRHRGNLMRHMSAHDPESTAAERALALKIGRQKKVQIIDGQQVEVMPGEETEEDEMEAEMEGNVVAVEGSDGQQYVVLEVIQLQDGDEEQVTVVGSGEHSLQDSVELLNAASDPTEILADIKPSNELKKKLLDRGGGGGGGGGGRSGGGDEEMENCFGFEEDDEETKVVPMDEDMEERESKRLIPVR